MNIQNIYDFNKTFSDVLEEGKLNEIEASIDSFIKATTPELIIRYSLPNITVGEVRDEMSYHNYKSPEYKKDIDKIRSMDYDVRAVLVELPLKNLLHEIGYIIPKYNKNVLISIPTSKVSIDKYLVVYKLECRVHYLPGETNPDI